MFSDRSRSTVLLAVPLLLAFAGCGKQGDPRPRPRNVPQTTSDLHLRLRGDRVLLDFSYPATTVAGLPLAGLESVTIYEVVREQSADAALPQLGPADLESLAQPLLEIAGRDLDNAVVGDRLRIAVPLRPAPEGVVEAHAFAVRTRALHGGDSAWSNAVAVRALPPVPSPSDLRVEARKEGVTLEWTPAVGSVGTAVLRRESTSPQWGEPIAELDATTDHYEDASALYGSRYVYTVVSRLSISPAVESAPSTEREVDYRDVFPPAKPRELHAVVLAGVIRLIWENPTDDDLAGVLVERSVDGGEFERLTSAPLDAAELVDRTAPKGKRIGYRLIAVDRSGNAAGTTAVAEVTAP